jgi:hypothetical protein
MMKFVAVSLLVLLALAGLPFAMDGGAMMTCPSCPSGHAPTTFSICLAVLAIVVAFSLVMSGRATVPVSRHSRIAVAMRLLKPPRSL